MSLQQTFEQCVNELKTQVPEFARKTVWVFKGNNHTWGGNRTKTPSFDEIIDTTNRLIIDYCKYKEGKEEYYVSSGGITVEISLLDGEWFGEIYYKQSVDVYVDSDTQSVPKKQLFIPTKEEKRIIQYIKDRRGNKKGVFVAQLLVEDDDLVWSANYSLCHTPLDKFDRKKGIDIAVGRLMTHTMDYHDVPQSIKNDTKEFLYRCNRYYLDKQHLNEIPF